MLRKSGKIHLCVGHNKLNSTTARDVFPLPQIGEALEAVHSNNYFLLFDITQGYLQLAIGDDKIKKAGFRPRSPGIYEFT